MRKEIHFCDICGKSNKETWVYKIDDKYYCNRHYQQIKKNGEIARTKYDKNKIVVKENYAEVLLYNFNGELKETAIIDLEDVKKIKQFKWCLNKQHYVITIQKGKVILMHRIITNASENKIVDHINHNTLDNRKQNLRVCTQTENMQNSSLRKDNVSGTKGVNYNAKEKKWRAYITINKKTKHLGWFKDKGKAIEARKKAEEKYFTPLREVI